jgi:adenylate cyclase
MILIPVVWSADRGDFGQELPAPATGGEANPRFVSLYAFHAMALSFAERSSEARLVVQRLLELEPAFRSRIFREVGFVPSLADKLYSGLRQLGGAD